MLADVRVHSSRIVSAKEMGFNIADDCKVSIEPVICVATQ